MLEISISVLIITQIKQMQSEDQINQSNVYLEEQMHTDILPQLRISHNSFIGAIIRSTKFDKYKNEAYSTGVLLSKNIVLTAASSVYNQQNYQCQNFQFYLPQQKIFYQVENIRYPLQYITAENKLQFNYAILKLKDEVNVCQFPLISLPCQTCLDQKDHVSKLQIYGFPIHNKTFLPLNKSGFQFIDQQYGMSKINSIYKIYSDEFRISYSIRTLPGLYGSPIIICKRIIGINVGLDDQHNSINFGRIIDRQLTINITKMCSQLGRDPFMIGESYNCQHDQDQQKSIRISRISRMRQPFLYNLENITQLRSLQSVMKNTSKILKKKREKLHQLQNSWNNFKHETKNQQLLNQNILLSSSEQVSNIQLLILTSQQTFKLTEKDMTDFSKVKLPFLTDLRLDNNRIRDEGLQILCGNMYPQLKRVSLDDNAITINGLKSILFNKWNEDVQYYLHSVQSNDGQYYLHVGESLPIMKKIIKTKDLNEIDLLIPAQKSKALNSMNLLLATPLDNQDPKQLAQDSQKLEQRYKFLSQQDPNSLSTVLLELKKHLGSSISFSEKSNIQSKLSSKIIFTGLLNQRVRFTKRFEKFNDFQFSDFRCNCNRLMEFQVQIKKFLCENYNIVATDMSIDKISEGSFIVDGSDSLTNAYVKNNNFFQNVVDEVKIYFQKLQLSEDQFDCRGDYIFPSIEQAENQIRGGLPYFQPVQGRRYGIKIENSYDNGNNDWLMMDGNKKQWAVAFHGVRHPTQKNKMRSIMNGRIQGNMLHAGFNQAYQLDQCLNRDALVEEGIYVSPYFLNSLIDYSEIENGQKYHLVLQCRVKPDSIKIPKSQPHYWVVNNPRQLRPYGIILFTDKDIQLFSKIKGPPEDIHKIIYKNQFTRQTWTKLYKKYFESFIHQE